MAFALYSPVPYVMNITALAILIFVGGHMAIDGVITIGTMIIFQRYINNFFQPIQELASSQHHTIRKRLRGAYILAAGYGTADRECTGCGEHG